MIPNYITCVPSKPDAKCNNCKRRLTKTKTQVHVINSKDKACIYIPISFQELPMETENKKPKSSGMNCCTYDCIQGRDCPVRKANSIEKKILDFVDEFYGSEQIRHPMFSEGYDYALWQMKQIIKGTENDPNLRNDETS